MVHWQLSHWQLSALTVVPTDSCPHWQLSALTVVWSDSCLHWQLSDLTVVRSYRCPIWQLISDSCLPTDYFYAKGLLGLGRSPSLEPGEYDGSLDDLRGHGFSSSHFRMASIPSSFLISLTATLSFDEGTNQKNSAMKSSPYTRLSSRTLVVLSKYCDENNPY